MGIDTLAEVIRRNDRRHPDQGEGHQTPRAHMRPRATDIVIPELARALVRGHRLGGAAEAQAVALEQVHGWCSERSGLAPEPP
jgi:hypothetical protein